MAKKRQADFGKTQLKVGRPVGKKRNVTNTSFVAKKITIQPNKGIKEQNKSTTIGDCLAAMKPTSKPQDFDELRNLINKDVNSLPTYLPEIFNFLFKIILEGHLDDTQRNTAVEEVVRAVLEQTTDLQIHTFIPHFINFLSCGMTHLNTRIKEQSLKVLMFMLRTHPKLICNSMNILTDLLQMLTGPPRKWSHSQLSNKNARKSSMVTLYNDTVYSPDWRIHVLQHINLFLDEMLKKKPIVEDPNRDEQEIYWDGEKPFFLEIYAGSGLKPMDIEKSLPVYFDDDDFYFDDSGSIETFFESIINIIPEIFNEELASANKYDDNLVSKGSIYNLSVLFQVLSKVVEWMHLIKYDEMTASVKKFLKESVWDKERFPFFQRGTSIQEIHGVRLNLAISFLFSQYMFDFVDVENLNSCIFAYVIKVFKNPYTIKYDSIPMLVKIMKTYFELKEKNEVLEFLQSFLTLLCGLLKGNSDNPNEKLLSSLFTKISLDPAYCFLAESDAMKNWFNWLMVQVTEMPKMKDKSEIDRNLLKVCKKIANRKYPYFQQLLEKNDSKIVKILLECDDDDVRDTGVFFFHSLEDLSTTLLQSVYRQIMLERKFPKKFILRILTLIPDRFSNENYKDLDSSASLEKGKKLFPIIQFLLNLAIDYCSIHNKRWIDYEDNEYTKAMKICTDKIPYIVIPSLQWKEHSIIFDAVSKVFNQIDEVIVWNGCSMIITEVLENNTVLPIHSVIAMLRLLKDRNLTKYLSPQMYDLQFCALITTSILTHMSADDDEDEWYKWNATAVMDSMQQDQTVSLKVLTCIQYMEDDQIDSIVGYHILRMIQFYLDSHLLDRKYYDTILELMKILVQKTVEKTLGRQPLFITLYQHFSYYSDL